MRARGMFVAVTAAVLLVTGTLASAANPGPALLEDAPWVPPPWSQLDAGARRAVARYADSTQYEAARTDTAFAMRRWRYASDTVGVIAFVFHPARGTNRPAVVYCRGSYVQNDLGPSFLPLFHRLASAGYFVVAPQYRGSEGGGGRDEMGGADVEDVLAAVRLAAAQPGVNPRAIYLYGESRGGMMTFQALRDGAPVRAAATVGAYGDLDTLFRDDPRSASMAPKIWPDYATRSAEIAERRSALRWADRIRVPLLILQGGDDRGVLPAQARGLSAALSRAKLPHELRIVPGGSHTLGERSAERDSLVLNWFRTHAP